jgi:DNA polymerase-1
LADTNPTTNAEQGHNSLLSAALGYHDAGIPVFPLCSPAWGPHTHYDTASKKQVECPETSWGKHPLVRWRQFQTVLPSREKVERWWTRWSDANIGMATGHLSGLVVGDFDGHVAVQEAKRRGLPSTAFVRTGKPGGQHHYFAWSDDAPRNFAGAVGGIDYRGEGGYVVLPPSRHYLGPYYAWGSPLVAQLPELPLWFAELKNERRQKPPTDDGKVYEPGRNDALTSRAGTYRAAGLDESEILALLLKFNADHCVPPLGEVEVTVIAHSVSRYEAGEAGSPPMGKGRARSRRAEPEPEDEHDRRILYALPTFPLAALPAEVQAYCRGSSYPTPYLAGAAMAALAIAIGGNASVVLGLTKLERIIIWSILLGRNGLAKSDSLESMFRPLLDADRAAHKRFQKELADWREAKAAGHKEDPPVDHRLLRGDMTGPALIRQLRVLADTGLYIPEISRVLRNTLSGRDVRALLDPGLMLSLWTGDDVTQGRVGEGRGGGNDLDLFAPEPTVSIAGDMQTFLHPLLGSDQDGSRPRWQPYAWDTPWDGHTREPTEDVINAYRDLIWRLVNRRSQKREWHLDERGQRDLALLTSDWAKRGRSAEQATYQAALFKAPRHLPRLAGDLAEAAATSVDYRSTLDPVYLEAAAKLVEYHLGVWLYLGDAETLSLTQVTQRLDPAVDRVRLYIEQQGDIDAETGRRSVTAKRLINHGVAGVKDVETRDQLVDRYTRFYPGCQVKRGKSVVLLAPERRQNGGEPPVDSPQEPQNDPSIPPEAPVDSSKAPVDSSKQPVDSPNQPVDSGESTGTKTPSRARAREATAETEVAEIVTEANESGGIAPEQPSENGNLAPAPGAPPPGARVTRAKTTPGKAELKLYADAAYTLVSSEAGFAKALLWLAEADTVALDLETTHLRPQVGQVRLAQLAADVDGVRRTFVCDLWRCGEWQGPLGNLLAHDEITFVGQEMPFDLGWLSSNGIGLPRNLFDVRIAAIVTEQSGSPGRSYDLRSITREHLERRLVKELQASDWSGDLTDAQLQYAANDAAVLLDLHKKLWVRIQLADREQVFDLEMSLTGPMVWLREAGLPIDVGLWRARTVEANVEHGAKLLELHHLAGTIQETHKGGKSASKKSLAARGETEHNWGSAPQNLAWFRAQGLDLETAGKEALTQVEHPAARALLEWRALGRRASYGQQVLDKALVGDRAYGSFTQLGTATGRMSCRTPNLQQMNRGRHYREAVRASAGHTLVKCDYSALQMRIAAEISGDPTLIQLFNDDGDPHTNTTVDVLHASADDDVARVVAKGVNFGFLFGAGARTARVTIRTGYGQDLPLETVEEYRTRYFQTYPGLKDWHNRWEHAVREAPLDVPDPSGSGRWRMKVLKYTERINTPVQMVEAHGVKLALLRLHREKSAWPGVRLVMIAHDEFVAEVPVNDADAYGEYLRGVMRSEMATLLHSVPVKVDLTINPTWWKDKAAQPEVLLSELDDEEEIR